MIFKLFLQVFVVTIIAFADQAKAAGIDQFISCLGAFESRFQESLIDRNQSEFEAAVGALQWPTITSSLGGQKDFLDRSGKSSTGFEVSVSQNIYSRSYMLMSEAYKKNSQSSELQGRAQLRRAITGKLELLFQYISSLEGLKMTEKLVQSQERLSQIAKSLAKAKVQDGALYLQAQSDYNLYLVSQQELALQVEKMRLQLNEFSFFSANTFSNESLRDRFFSFASDLEPTTPEQVDEVLALQLKADAEDAFLSAESSQWQPRLDVAATYKNYQLGSTNSGSNSEMLGQLTLTWPLSESYSRQARKRYRLLEQQRNLKQKDRTQTEISIQNENEKKNIKQLASSLEMQYESLKLLNQAREVLMRKMQVNQVSYLEVSTLDQKIYALMQEIVAKKISIWRTKISWLLAKRKAFSSGIEQRLCQSELSTPVKN